MSNGDSTFELLSAIRARLTADAALKAIVGSRVYDSPPETVVFPYVQVGDVQTLPFEDGGCIDGSEQYPTIHTWARSQTASADVHRMNAAIRAALHNQALPLAGHTLQTMQFQTSRVMRDRDGVTRHGILDFRAFTTAA